jgi:CHAT domain-containing protein
MTYDEMLTLDGLQALLRADRGRQPIDMLILSACQTAEGDDRAPLGMAGSAIKSGARAAMGTLWPVFDEAASRVMSGFYRRLAEGRTSRIEALREAQLELIAERATEHPIHWAPFILIGDWR